MRCLLIAFQLPIEPGHSDAGEFAAVWLVVCAAVANPSLPGTKYGDRLNVLEVGICVVVCNVGCVPANVSHRNVDGFEILFAECFSAAHVRRLREEAAVPDHGGCDARVRGNFDRLHSSARLTHHRNLPRVEVLIVFARRTLVFSCSPFDRVEHLGRMSSGGRQISRKLRGISGLLNRRLRRRRGRRSRLRRTSRVTFHNRAESYGDESIRRDIRQKVTERVPGVRAGAVAPDDDRQSGAIQPRQIFRPVDCVVRQACIHFHYRLVRAGSGRGARRRARASLSRAIPIENQEPGEDNRRNSGRPPMGQRH